MQELQRINPLDFGLDVFDAGVSSIEEAFQPKIAEYNGFISVYEQIIIKELSPELCKEARELRLKLVKVRTGISDVHKSQKAFFLAAGKFVDAWKNKSTLPVEQMEQKLEDIEKHYEKIEAARIEQVKMARISELAVYGSVFPDGLGSMADEVYANYLAGVVHSHKLKKEAEEKAEAERIAAAAKVAAEQVAMRIENEKLKAEAQERERLAAIERKKADDALREERAKAEKEKQERERLEKEIESSKAEEKQADAETITIPKSEYNKMIEAIKYIIDVWDEVSPQWKQTPDHVQRKFLLIK